MIKERVQRLVVGLFVILLVASALGYYWFPRRCWVPSVWTAPPGDTFLVRTLAAVLSALSPAA